MALLPFSPVFLQNSLDWPLPKLKAGNLRWQLRLLGKAAGCLGSNFFQRAWAKIWGKKEGKKNWGKRGNKKRTFFGSFLGGRKKNQKIRQKKLPRPTQIAELPRYPESKHF
jgi:hypothetical protein